MIKLKIWQLCLAVKSFICLSKSLHVHLLLHFILFLIFDRENCQMLMICSSFDSQRLALCKLPNPSLIRAAHKMLYLMAGLGQAMKDKEWFSDYLRDPYLEHCNKRCNCCELRCNWNKDWHSGLSIHSISSFFCSPFGTMNFNYYGRIIPFLSFWGGNRAPTSECPRGYSIIITNFGRHQ